MLNFDTALSNPLKLSNTTAFWVLKLYHNNSDNQVYQSDGTTANQTAEAVDTSETAIDVDYGAGFIANDIIKIDSEIMKVTSVSSNTINVIRGFRGSTKATHSDNTSIYFDNWIGVSDQHRVDGTDIYHGIVANWGSYSQSLDFFSFTTSIGNMSVKLINTDASIQGGRFSDLFSTLNFANRKWELFLNTNSAGTYDTSARMIGTGIISGNIEYDTKYINLSLLDKGVTYHRQLPKNIVTSASYPNAPEKNINKPIPMSYGNFHDREDVGTIPTSGANFDRHFTYKFPAIVVDEWDEDNARVKALIDSVVVNELDTENVYMKIGDHYGACNSSNVIKDESNFYVTATGVDWKVYVPLQPHGTYDGGSNYDNMIDNSFSGSPYNLSQSGAGATSVGFRVGKLPNLGVFTSAKLLCDFGNFTGSAPAINFRLSAGAGAGGDTKDTITWNGGDDNPTATGFFDTNQQTAWDVETEIFLTIDNSGGSGNMSVDINEVGLEFQVKPSQTFTVEKTEEQVYFDYLSPFYDKGDLSGEAVQKRKKIVTTSTEVPQSADYLFASGKGREFGSWVDADSRNNGYNSGDLIPNPIYMIEDILRTELGLTSSEIDYELFDTAGNTTDGEIGVVLAADAVRDVKYAISQNTFIDSQDLINKISKQALCWVWASGDGRMKIRSSLLPTTYSTSYTANKVINYNNIIFKSISRTPLNNVRNDIDINYRYDHIQKQPLKTANSTDSTSKGTTVDGYNYSDGLKLELVADAILDSTTASNLAVAYKNIMKDRKVIIKFDCPTPMYNDLEITDIITFKNWDSKIKLYGTAMSTTDYFIVKDISKSVNGCSITAIKVDE